MSSGGGIGRFGGAVLVVLTLLLAACEDEANSFRELSIGATATVQDANPPPPDPVKVMVVGDVASPALAELLGGRNFEVTDVPFDNSFVAAEIDMAGDYIVWTDNRNGNRDIYGYRISTATEFPISTAGGVQRSPRVSGDYVVWEDYRDGNADIYAYRLSSGTGFAVTTALHNQRFPQIDGDYVVWQDGRNGNDDIYAYRLSSATELAISTAADNQWYPQIDGDYIVWQSYQGGFSDIHAYRISSATTSIVSQAAGSQYNPVISGNYVVWMDNRNGSDDIYAYDLGSGQEIVVSSAPSQQLRPRVSGDYAVWQDDRNGNYDIYAYHFPSATEIAVVVESGDQTFPVIHGDLIAWQDKRSGTNTDIYAYRLSSGETIRITNHITEQSRPVLNADRIAWFDGRRGLVDVMFREGTAGADQVATRWPTPAGVTDFGDNRALLLGSDIFSEEVMLQLFDAAVEAGVGVLGLGGSGASLAAALANAGRYGISVTPASGCFPTQLIALDSDHPVFTDLNTASVLDLETTAAVTRDELAITTDAGDPASPMDWQVLASFSGNMCNASAPALVEFSTANGTPVLLDGSVGVADKYAYWNDDRRTLLVNALTYLARK